ncbi:MAG: hypothetical protein ACKOJG_08175, partial [Actinomycetota bacterium]
VYERFNGHLVVVFEVDICTTKITRAKQELINRLNGQLPFTTFKLTKATKGEQTVTAMHSLSVSTIAAEQLMHALDSIAYQVLEQRFVRCFDIASLLGGQLRVVVLWCGSAFLVGGLVDKRIFVEHS